MRIRRLFVFLMRRAFPAALVALAAEGGSRTQLMRVGWTGNEVKPGDKVTVRGHPPRDASSKLIHMEYLTLPDGTERFTEDIKYGEFIERRRRPE